MKIAIIGTGISGLGAAYLLNPHHDITVFEKNDYCGGHSRTIAIDVEGQKIPVDTGFIVFNKKNYPHLTALFDHLDIPYEKSKMSFGASIDGGWLEYASTGMFAQKSNLFKVEFWRMIFDILRFNKSAMGFVGDNKDMTLQDCLDQMKMGPWFRQYYLLAMGAAIWSCNVETILKFPARTFLQFFDNHGLLTINNHPQWYTVSGGSREYVARLTESFRDKIKTSVGIIKVVREDNAAIVHTKDGGTEKFDKVIFACHANEALALINDPSQNEKDILGDFSYQDNVVVLHGDDSFMPKRKQCWASWIYLNEGKIDKKSVVSLSYWMNNLQNLKTSKQIFVTLNPGRSPDKALVYNTHVFSHPVFDLSAIHAQEKVDLIQGVDGYYFCGAYQRYGFHEDGLLSAVNVAQKIGVPVPWR